jgi:hypothetical protein
MRSNLLWAAFVAASMLALKPAHAVEDTATCTKSSCVRPDVTISPTGQARALIAADPAQPGRLVVGSSDPKRCGYHRQSVNISVDDGARWDSQCLPFPPDDFFGSPNDGPAVAIGPGGVLLAAASYDDGADTEFVGAHRSTDNGATWEFLYAGGTGYFKGDVEGAHLGTDAFAKSPHQGNAYIVYAAIGVQDDASRIRLSRSIDGGKTWSSVPVSPEWDTRYVVAAPSLAIARDGTLYLTHTLCESFNCTGGDVYLYVSADGGLNWKARGVIATVGAGHRPMLAVDASSGAYKGRLYLVAAEGGVVTIRQSADQGKSWSAPMRVAKGPAVQSRPWAAVSDRGELGITWMDARNDPARQKVQPMLALSSDGGASFSKAVALDADLLQSWGGDIVSHAWAGRRLRAAFIGANDDGSMGLRAGGLR